jgi:peptide/nickel transport system permease protein
LVPHDPLKHHYDRILAFPSSEFLLGNDEFGRDILSRLLTGARPSLVVGFGSVLIAVIFGVPLGLIGGYFEGFYETLVMRFVDLVISFPPIFLAIAMVNVVGSGINSLIFTIGFLYIPRIARIAYSATCQVREEEYVQSSRAIGQKTPSILLKDILPNISSPIIVQASFTVAFAILLESGLGFLGLGVPPPQPSWGVMLGQGKAYMTRNPLLVIWPALSIAVTLIIINLLGDSLRDMLDPKTRIS